MANKIYPKYKEAAMGGGANHDLLGGNIKAILIDDGAYTYSDAHEFLSSIPGGARIATSGNLTGKTVTNGAFKCADFSWAAVSGAQSEAVAFFVDTGAEGTSRLVAYLDSGQATLPITPTGSNINFTVHADGIFRI